MAKKDFEKTLAQSQTAKRMTLAEWRSARVHELVLPSGLNVQIRDASMTDLMLTGKLPDSFLDMADKSSKEGKKTVDLKSIAQDGEDFRKMLDALLLLCMIEPRITDTASDETVTLAEIPSDDKMFIFNFLNREVETQVKSFRAGEVEPVAVV